MALSVELPRPVDSDENAASSQIVASFNKKYNANAAKESASAWLEVCRLGHAQIGFGPSYAMETSSGLPVRVATVFFDETGDGQPDRRIYLFACDQAGLPAGYASMRFSEYVGHSDMFVESSMATFQKNRGYATTVGIAQADIIQREANRRQRRIVHDIVNDNLAGLNELRKAGTSKQSEMEVCLLESKKEEQKRWQRIFGSSGIFGFNTYGRRLIVPNAAYDDIAYIDEITITRDVALQTWIVTKITRIHEDELLLKVQKGMVEFLGILEKLSTYETQ